MDTEFHLMPALSRTIQQPCASDLAMPAPTVTCEQSNGAVLEVFGLHRELISLPVLENQSPMGLISRNIFMSQMSKPYHRELYEKKSCIAFMDKDPLVVEAATPIEDLAAQAVASGDKALIDGFMIVEQGRFTGVGSGLDLMRKMVELQSEKNRQVMQSIDYASVIQRAKLSTSRQAMRATLADACVVWEPRDLVGGDFYHFEGFPEGWFAAVADCTGHGVPGAFLTLIASSALAQAINRHGPRDPALLMGEVNRGMKEALGQHAVIDRASESDDGMDATFFWFDAATRNLICANARMPLFVLTPDQEQVQTVDGERTGLGYVDTRQDMVWKNRTVPLASGAIVFAATDGIIDQIGGAKNIAYGKQRLRDALLRHRGLPMPALADTLMQEQQLYQGRQRRRDDLTFFGFRAT